MKKLGILVVITGIFLMACTPSPNAKSKKLEDFTKEFQALYSEAKYDKAGVVAKKVLALAEKDLGPDHPSVAQSLNNLALLYKSQGKYE